MKYSEAVKFEGDKEVIKDFTETKVGKVEAVNFEDDKVTITLRTLEGNIDMVATTNLPKWVENKDKTLGLIGKSLNPYTTDVPFKKTKPAKSVGSGCNGTLPDFY